MANQSILSRLKSLDIKAYMDTNGDMLISEAIFAMQEAKALSYNCPRCEVEGIPQGVIELTDIDTVVVCEICVGYMKTDVQFMAQDDGSYTSVDDHTDPDTVTPGITERLRPFDLWNFLTENDDMLLSEAIALIQGDTYAFDCPKCDEGSGPTGIIDGHTCDLCDGMLKTNIEFTANESGGFDPVIPEPVIAS